MALEQHTCVHKSPATTNHALGAAWTGDRQLRLIATEPRPHSVFLVGCGRGRALPPHLQSFPLGWGYFLSPPGLHLLCPGEGSTLPEKNPLSSHWILTHRSVLSDYSEQFTHTGKFRHYSQQWPWWAWGPGVGWREESQRAGGSWDLYQLQERLRYCIEETAMWSG